MNQDGTSLTAPERGVHQALFGYSAGHGLLAASSPLEPDTERLLARLTDDTGAAGIPEFDGYLSGFPLPDSRYAIARTWNAPEAPRRGSVWSHVLLLDGETRVTSKELMGLLQRPSQNDDLGYYRRYLPLPLQGSPKSPRGRPGPRPWAAPLLSEMLTSPTSSAWTVVAETREAEATVLSFWDWLWPAAQRSLSFCLGGTGPRTVGRRPFSVLAIPSSFRRSAALDLGPQAETATPEGELLATVVIRGDGDSLTRFCQFAGAETSELGGLAVLLHVWRQAVQQPTRPAPVTFDLVASTVARAYPQADKMRRLKRLLVMPQPLLPVPWTTRDVAGTFARSSLAEATLAIDIDVDELLVSLANEPETLIALLRQPEQRPPVTVLDALRVAAPAVLAANADPSWLPLLATENAPAAGWLLTRLPPKQRPPWAASFWDMPAERANSLLAHDAANLAWVLAYDVEAGRQWLESAAAEPPVTVVLGLLRELNVMSDPWHWIGRLPQSATGQTLATIRGTSAPVDSDELTALLAVSEPTAAAIRDEPMKTWRTVDFSQRLGAAAAAHLLQSLPTQRPGKADIMLSAAAYAAAWAALSRSDEVIWKAVGDFPVSLPPEHQWDRARRLARAYAVRLAAWDAVQATVSARELGAVTAARYHPEAGGQLRAALRDAAAEEASRQQKPQKKGKKKKSLAGQAWDVAQDVIGIRWR